MKNPAIAATVAALALFLAGCISTAPKGSGGAKDRETVATVHPATAQAIAAGEAVAPFLPPPFGTILSGALATLSAGLAVAVRRRNGQLATEKALSDAIMDGVERAAIPAVKQAIDSVADARDVRTELKGRLVSKGYSKPGAL